MRIPFAKLWSLFALGAAICAVAPAAHAQQVLVAHGTFTPDPTLGRQATLAVSGGVRLEGGFLGCADSDVAPPIPPTILSGDLLQNDVPGVPATLADKRS